MATDYKALKNGGFIRQVQKGNSSLQLRVVGGDLAAEQLSTVAEISKKYDGGYVYLTSHQGVGILFIKLGDMGFVKMELEEGGIDTSVCEPRVRTVVAYQGSTVCPSGCIDTHTLATEISGRYFGRELPHEFKFGTVGCQNDCLKTEENDMDIKGGYTMEWIPGTYTLCGVCPKAYRGKTLTQADGKIVLKESKCINCGRCFKACSFDAWKGESGYLVSFGGTLGNLATKDRQVLSIIRDKETLFWVTDAAMAFFGKRAKSGEYLRVAIGRIGWDEFETEIEVTYCG